MRAAGQTPADCPGRGISNVAGDACGTWRDRCAAELRARTVRSASQRSFMVMPPPAPVPTTIASKSLVAYVGLLIRDSRCCCGMIDGLRRCACSRSSGCVQAGILGQAVRSPIAERFQPDLEVVADDGVVAHHLKEFAADSVAGLNFVLYASISRKLFCWSALQSRNCWPNSEVLRALIQLSPARKRT